MRPGRPDIAAPEFPPGIEWVGNRPLSMSKLAAAGPVLVQFFDFAQLNSVRALPYVSEWHRRYADAGLSVVGVQAPRFRFGADPAAVEAGLRRLGVSHPVAIDSDRRMWLDYGCDGWPSLFLWGRGGVLRWYHFGEGDYAATEEAIQEQLREGEPLRELPSPLEPLRSTDAPGAAVMPPLPHEWFPSPREDQPWAPREAGETQSIDYQAGAAFATVDGIGELRVGLDTSESKTVEVDGAFLYELTNHPRHETHELFLGPAPGIRIWSVSFAPGVP